jgi:hypothetical protein
VTTKRNGTTICYSIAPGILASLGARITQLVMTAPEAAAVTAGPAGPGSG